MPAYTRLSRPALLAVATPLIAAARELFPSLVVRAAAQAAEDAAVGLDLELGGRRSASARLSAAAAAALAAEESLDRRVGALARALAALGDLGLPEAEDLHDQLFPQGHASLTERTGRAQAPAYAALAGALGDTADHPAAARLAPAHTALREDLLAWCEAVLAKDTVHREGAAAASHTAAATATLRAALQHLDRAVELEAGGPSAPLYTRWALVARGIA